jgi:hypothetical protein
MPHLDRAPLGLGETQRRLYLLSLVAVSGHVDNGNSLPWLFAGGLTLRRQKSVSL